jgi:hypothetical protein
MPHMPNGMRIQTYRKAHISASFPAANVYNLKWHLMFCKRGEGWTLAS